MDRNKTARLIRRVWFSVGLAAVSAVLFFTAQGNPGWVGAGYHRFSQAVSAFLARLFAWTSVSAAEILLILLLVAAVAGLAAAVVLCIRRRAAWPFLGYLSRLALGACTLLFLFLTFWGLSYYAPSLDETLGLDVKPRPPEALVQTAVWLEDNLNALAGQVPRNEQGACDFGGFAGLETSAGQGFGALSQQYPFFTAAASPPKRVIHWILMSRTGIAGIYIPLTGEANVNPDTPESMLPFTMVHELSHRQGIAPEDEANFAAFLSCEANEDVRFVYSGYLTAFIYCYNAAGDIDGAQPALWERLDPRVIADFEVMWEHSRKYAGPVRDLGERINDTYLKTMSQPEGVKSYGRVADLLIAEYVRRFGEPGLV